MTTPIKRLFERCILLCALALLTGCITGREFRSVPQELVENAQIPGMTQVRTWGDQVEPWFIASLAESVRQEDAYYESHPGETAEPAVNILAISGGGQIGAYGAGLLCGWSAAGTRPEFKLVTGISTGALIAPLAFLGHTYDPVLKRAYTTISEDDVVRLRSLFAILTKDGLADTEPLATLLEDWLTPEMFAEIAKEHAKGRRLLIATVNLEAQRPVIWDMGAIASSGHPEALTLFRRVMLASASIPGAFEPQYVEVEIDGERYEELHVDGGTMAQVFLWGSGVNLHEIGERIGIEKARRPIHLYVVRNGSFYPEYQMIRGRFVDIAGRALSTLIKTQAIGDMYRLYTVAQANGMAFNLASVPPEFQHPHRSEFDQEFMVALFTFAFEQTLAGNAWQDRPPFAAATDSNH